MDGGQVADGEFVEPGRHGPMLFELVDAPLDSIAVMVEDRVERRRSSAGTAAAVSARGLVGRDRDRCFDPAAT